MSLHTVEQALPNLTLAELKALPEKIAGMITEREKAEKDAARAELAEMAKAKGFDIGELFGKSGKPAKEKKTVAPKYRNPADASQTWTGRGRKPKWIVEALASGGQIEDFLIIT